MVDLNKLAKKKDKLNRKLKKLQGKIEIINKEALSLQGTGGWGKDLFIKCLVENLHFEQTDEINPVGNGIEHGIY